MRKAEAIKLLGGVTGAATAIGITRQAVGQWPEELPATISDRVLAALARRHPDFSAYATAADAVPAPAGAAPAKV